MTANEPAWGRALTIEQALFFAQWCRCFYCQREFDGPRTKRNHTTCWSRDHLMPAEKGNGRARNLVLACGDCNSKKANRAATDAEVAAAEVVHKMALRYCQIFNGGVPPEWLGTRESAPTKRALDRQYLGLEK